MAVHEALLISDDLRTAIVEGRSIHELRRMAKEQGMTPLFADGIQKALEGQTTLQEIIREVEEGER
jgi:type IV pilus assembly protein PilB